MDNSAEKKPLRFALAFFRFFCKPELLEDIEGDLLERFHMHLSSAGIRKAQWLFIKDVVLLFRPGIIRRFNGISQQKNIHMKSIHWNKLTGLNLLVVILILSPFIPGPSNKIVLALSVVGQLVGVFGLLLVPIDLSWAIIELKKSKASTEESADRKWYYNLALSATLLIALAFMAGFIFQPNPMPKISFLTGFLLVVSGFFLAQRQIKKWKDGNEQIAQQGAPVILAVTAIVCLLFICLLLVLSVFVFAGVIAGAIALLLLSTGMYWAIKQIGRLRHGTERKINQLPLYFVTIPLTAFLVFMFFVKPASDFSRSYAIKKSESLIASIEAHKTSTGQYPESIEDLYANATQHMPTPSVMGISNFRYYKINDSYSLSFSQWLDLGSLEEIVLYDKNDLKNNLTGEFAKYNYDFDLCRVKGAFKSHETNNKDWRYYWVD